MQAPTARLDEVAGAEPRPGRHVFGVAFGLTVLAALAVVSGVAAAVVDWADGLGSTTLYGVLAVLGAVVVAGAVVAARSYRRVEHDVDALADRTFHDPLTGLPNRRFLGRSFDDLLRDSRRYNGRVAVLFIDLDGFKRVNDAHGHDAGDRLMQLVAERLRQSLTGNDFVVRFGGDEFVALCPDVTNAGSAENIARRLIKSIEQPYELGEAQVALSACVGLAITEQRCNAPDEVLRDAEAAVYQAKARGPGTYAMFDRSLRDQITPSTAEKRLRNALERGEFRLYYQPIVSLWTKRLVGVEALLRWNDPNRGMVNPQEFLPVLEDTGLIVPIGTWVLEQACFQSKAWQDNFPDRPPVNIKLNVSARQLAQANFVEHLRACLDRSGADPERISLEIAEGALMFDVMSSWTTLRECKKLGISLALDDFGTGYSSLSYLRRFNLDLLQIDKSFIDGIGTSREDTAIVEHVIGMAKALGIVTVAEGVETTEQVEQLRAMNCDLAQGYYFSHPQPPNVISRLLEANANKQEWRPGARPDAEVEAEAAAPAVVLPAEVTGDAAGSHDAAVTDGPAPLPRR